MPTKYDVFAKVIEKGPCKAGELDFETEVYVQLKELVSINWIKAQNNIYTPIRNKTTKHAFDIIKYCIKNNLDYNQFFSKKMPEIISELISNPPNLRPKNLKNNRIALDILSYLETNQFILVHSKKPYRGILLRHQLLENIIQLKNKKVTIKKPKFLYPILQEKIKKIKGQPINPFDEKTFSFLAGSAQLEGATISTGETRNLLVNDIYPEKPQKDIQMVKNLNEALHHVIDHLDEDITEEHIKKINYLVMFSMHRNAGKYKITQNKIQGNPNFKTASPSKVKELMKSYCEVIQQITPKNVLSKLGYVHNELQHIHPFADGNSRTIRMVLNWVALKNQLPLIILKMGCFDEYMNLTKLSKERDDEELNHLFWNLILHENMIK